MRLDPIAHGALFDGPLTASRAATSVPITATLRFVIQRNISQPGPAQPAAAIGYFVVTRDGRSLRLDPIGSGRLLQQPL